MVGLMVFIVIFYDFLELCSIWLLVMRVIEVSSY